MVCMLRIGAGLIQSQIALQRIDRTISLSQSGIRETQTVINAGQVRIDPEDGSVLKKRDRRNTGSQKLAGLIVQVRRRAGIKLHGTGETCLGSLVAVVPD